MPWVHCAFGNVHLKAAFLPFRTKTGKFRQMKTIPYSSDKLNRYKEMSFVMKVE